MSLQEKIHERNQKFSSGENVSTLDTEILALFRSLIEEIKNINLVPEKRLSHIENFYNNYLLLTDQFFSHNALDILQLALDLCSPNIYKHYFELGHDILHIDQKIEKALQSDDLAILLIWKCFHHTSYKESIIYLRTANEKYPKNAQRKLFIADLFHLHFENLEKKEIFYAELLPDILRNLNYSLRHYVKFRNRLDNKEGSNVSEHHQNYIYNYEKWMTHLLKKYFETIKHLIDNQPHSQCKILLVNDLYDLNIKTKGVKTLQPSSEKLISHYCALFLLDILEGACDAYANTQLEKPMVKSMINELVKTLQVIHPYLTDYLINYTKQLKLLNYDPSILKEANAKADDHLPFKNYTKNTMYNPAGMAQVLISFMEDTDGNVLYTSEYKLKLFLPTFHNLLKTYEDKSILKNQLLVFLDKLFQSLNKENHTDNINYFGAGLDEITKEILEYAGGMIEEQEKQLSLNIFNKISDFLKEPAQINLLTQIIKKSANASLKGHIVDIYRMKLIKSLNNIDNLSLLVSSPYTNLNTLKAFLDATFNDSISDNISEKTDLLSSGLNMLIYLIIKFNNYAKSQSIHVDSTNTTATMTATTTSHSDTSNVFNLANKDLFIKYATKAISLMKKINEQIDSYSHQINAMDKKHPNYDSLNVKQNQFFLVKDNITRVEELLKEMKSS